MDRVYYVDTYFLKLPSIGPRGVLTTAVVSISLRSNEDTKKASHLSIIELVSFQTVHDLYILMHFITLFEVSTSRGCCLYVYVYV